MNLDLFLFNRLNGLAGKYKRFDYLAIFCAEYLGYAMAAILLLAAIFLKNISLFFIPVLSGLFARFVMNEIVYFFYKRKRPPIILGITPLIKVPGHPAFPSGHASFFSGLSFSVLFFNFGLGIFFIIASCAVGIARIFCGVHWPSDILAGMLAGLAPAYIIYLFFPWIFSSL